MKIIITDLTGFKNQDAVCIAGVTDEGAVIRPMPYLSARACQELDIHPGGILEGNFTPKKTTPPHIEDTGYGELNYVGPCSKTKFREALEATLYPNISDGFEVEIVRGQKCLPLESSPVRSLITIKVKPSSFSVVQNEFEPSKLRAHFSDGKGTELSFVGVTDLGFYDYSQQHAGEPRKIAAINNFIHSQEQLYLRIGLSRAYKSPDGRNGYWIQLNGIYTFPDYLKYIRCYD